MRALDQIPDRLSVISMEFLSVRCRRRSWQNVLAMRSKERRLFSQVIIFHYFILPAAFPILWEPGTVYIFVHVV